MSGTREEKLSRSSKSTLFNESKKLTLDELFSTYPATLLAKAKTSSNKLFKKIANQDSLESIKMLIADNPGLISKMDEQENTAFHIAAKADRHDLFPLLIENGLNINAVNKQGFTPLHLAATGAGPQTISELFRLGADGNAKVTIQAEVLPRPL